MLMENIGKRTKITKCKPERRRVWVEMRSTCLQKYLSAEGTHVPASLYPGSAFPFPKGPEAVFLGDLPQQPFCDLAVLTLS